MSTRNSFRERCRALWHWWLFRHQRREELRRQFLVESDIATHLARYESVIVHGTIVFADGAEEEMSAIGRNQSDAAEAWVRKGDRKNLWRLLRRLVYLESR